MIYKGVIKETGVCVVRGLAAAPVGGEPASAVLCAFGGHEQNIHIL